MKHLLNTEKAAKAIGPYSQGVDTGHLLFLSGQLPIDPQKGKITADTVEEQTKQSLNNVKSILESAGGSMRDIVKTTVYLSDIGNFMRMNDVYGTFFDEADYPARSAFQVAALPQGALVEIEVVALKQS